MSDGVDPNPELTRLERLAALLRDDGVDIEAMSHDQLEQYLKESKMDMAAPQKRFNTILKKAEARCRLEAAHRRRLDAVERAKSINFNQWS